MRDAQKRIARALLQLLEDQASSDISIGELCEQAQIARTTFYYYYRSVNEAMTDLLVRLLGQLRPTDLSGTEYCQEYLRALQWMKDHENVCLNFRSGIQLKSIDGAVRKLMSDRIAELVKKTAGEQGVEDKVVDRICDSGIHILIGETIAWLDKGMPDSAEEHLEQMLITYDGFIEYVLQNYRRHAAHQ